MRLSTGFRPTAPVGWAKARLRCFRTGGAVNAPWRPYGAGQRGFTLIEVLVALSVVAVALTSIGALIATTVRGTRSLDTKLAAIETARAVLTALPDRNLLKPGTLSGEMQGHRWRVDVLPFNFRNIDPRLPTPWVPLTVVVSVQAPNGPTIQISTVRLRKRESF